MILTILVREPLHGYGISQRLAVLSRDRFHVNPGSLVPSLYRLEQDGKLKTTNSSWFQMRMAPCVARFSGSACLTLWISS
jgi:hypothetical protein